MYKTYNKWPEIARRQYEIEFENINLDDFNHIIFAGMGG